MFYRLENGVIVGGPYNCDQQFPVVKLDDNNPMVVAFSARVNATQPALQAPNPATLNAAMQWIAQQPNSPVAVSVYVATMAGAGSVPVKLP